MTDPSTLDAFRAEIREGIPSVPPPPVARDSSVSHAPVRPDLLSPVQKRLAIANALRYFPASCHDELGREFREELDRYGRIYMYRFRPRGEMMARPLHWYPARSVQAASIMLMIQNNLDPRVAQHPHELITYGGNGAVFQNWAQYRLTMRLLSEMTDEQTLVMYSGHPMGLFPSHPDAPRVVVTNGLMVHNYSRPEDWERFNALGVTQYGQMTAGSYMYIGPQGIVHGTTITLMNAARKLRRMRGMDAGNSMPGEGLLFVSSGLGGMSGAQPKAARIAGFVSVTAEVNPEAARKRHRQGWVDQIATSKSELLEALRPALERRAPFSLAYLGNIVDLWEILQEEDIRVDVGSDQTSLHNPWSGGYYPAGISFDDANLLIAKDPNTFREHVRISLKRQARAINAHSDRGMYFFDYGNAFLLEASRAGADVLAEHGDEQHEFRYPSYVQDILGPMCFDYGFGPFRWVCCSGLATDLERTDAIARQVMEEMLSNAPEDIRGQLEDNIRWIRQAGENNLVVGSQARILYADADGRQAIARAFNDAILRGEIGPVVLGRDHHDVSGTDSPYRETSNIYDGSRFTADMAVHNFVGDAFRGATWVSLHNGGGVGWGEAVNGGFGMLLDGSDASERRLSSMLRWDVHNGIARRAWARNAEALATARRAMAADTRLVITMPHLVDPALLHALIG